MQVGSNMLGLRFCAECRLRHAPAPLCLFYDYPRHTPPVDAAPPVSVDTDTMGEGQQPAWRIAFT